MMAFGVMGFWSYGLSELWVVGVMGRRNRGLTISNFVDETNVIKKLIKHGDSATAKEVLNKIIWSL